MSHRWNGTMVNGRIEAFLSVAQKGSVAAAARAAFISPQALLQQMNGLENELGFPLFERGARGVTLTPAGEIFAEGAKEMLDLQEQTVQKAKLAATLAIPTVRVGVQSFNQGHSLLASVDAYRKRYPNHPVEVIALAGERDFSGYLDWVRRGYVDVIQAIAPQDGELAPDLHTLNLSPLGVCCVMAPGHPLSGKDSLTPEDLKTYPVATHRVSVSCHIAKPLYDAGLDIELIEDGGESPRALLYETDMATSGKVLVVPEPYALQLPNLERIPLIVRPFCECLVYSDHTNPAVERFVGFAVTQLKKLQDISNPVPSR